MNKKNSLKLVATFTFAGVLSALPAHFAQARTVTPAIGRAVNHADQGCFTDAYTTITNTCATSKTWDVPLTLDTFGNKSVVVYAYGATASNNVGCNATGINRELTSVWGSGNSFLPSFGTSQPISLSTYVPSNGSLYVNCVVNNGGRINNVNWNQ